MFQVYIWWNNIENNAVKVHLYERFKIDVLGTFLRCRPTDIFSEHFENVRRTFLQNFKNKQQLTFKYLAQHIWWVGLKIIQQECVLYYVQNWRPRDVSRTSLCRRHFRTQLGRPWDVYLKYHRGTLKLYFENVIIINFIECVKLTFSWHP